MRFRVRTRYLTISKEHCYPVLFRETQSQYGGQISIEFRTYRVFGTPVSNGNSVHPLYLKKQGNLTIKFTVDRPHIFLLKFNICVVYI